MTSQHSEGGLRVTIDKMAHGGEGIGTLPDGRVVFVAGGFPGDHVEVELTKSKKNFAHAAMRSVLSAGPHRVASVCPAAELGAGCCDFAALNPAAELDLKVGVLEDQLRRIGKLDSLPTIDTVNLAHRQWRTRVRLGVDEQGRAGLRKKGSHDLVTTVGCTQLVPGLIDGIVGADEQRFTPGSEVIAVMDATGTRHVVETQRAARGRRVERVTTVIEGSGDVTERIGEHEFHFPATAFWQAHREAPETYADIVARYISLADASSSAAGASRVAWDLYGGVGAFVPAIVRGMSAGAGTKVEEGELAANPLGVNPVGENPAAVEVYSVDYSPAATAKEQPDLQRYAVHVVPKKVEAVAGSLPAPHAVVLDPPRTGAGDAVIRSIAGAQPHTVVHIGCDPATFARDVKAWRECGYTLSQATVINAFPGTHHFEVIALLKIA